MKKVISAFAKPFVGLLLGLLLSLSLVTLAGENPWNVFLILGKSAFGSRYDLGLALFYSTSLIFTGLSVCLAFHAGLFNIGAEGQLTVGALAAAWFAIGFPELPAFLAPWLALIAGLLAGGFWGFIPGWLRAVRGSHEVIVTMMMNFVAAAVASYVTLQLIKNPESQNPESQMIPPQFALRKFDFVQSFFLDSPANLALIVAVLLAIACYFFLYNSVWGYELRAVGLNPKAAEIAGISSRKSQIRALTMAGICAGFVSLNEVMGSSLRFKMGFSPEYGFIGIAVALMARNNPLGVIFSAFLFGVLQKGASDLDLETETITRDFARVIQAILIFSVAGIYFFNFDQFKAAWRKRWIKKV